MNAKERLRQALDTMTEEEAGAALSTLAEASGDPAAWMLNHAPGVVLETKSMSVEVVKAEFGIR